MIYETQRKITLPAPRPVVVLPAGALSRAGMMQKESISIDALARVFPQNFPLARLRDEGRRSREVTTEVELEGDIYAIVPGSNQAYRATRAVVSWVTPMDVQVLAIENKRSADGVDIKVGKFEFKGYKEPQRVVIPN